MQNDSLTRGPACLTDDELVSEIVRLVKDHRSATVTLIAHLMEFDARRLYLAAACRSLFLYCTQVLRLSEHEAYHRIEAARVARSFPVVLRLLAGGALTLTTVRLLSGQLTAENHESLLTAAMGKSKREVEVLLAKVFPSPAVASSLRKLPVRRPTSIPTSIPTSRPSAPYGGSATSTPSPLPTSVPAINIDVPPTHAPEAAVSALRHLDTSTLTATHEDDRAAASEPTPNLFIQPVPPSKRQEVVRPLAEDRYELRVTLSSATREKLRRATDLLRHAIPGGEAAQVIDRALTVLLGDLARKKFAATARPRPAEGPAEAPAARTRHVPAQVKRAVWTRDGGRCAFVSREGRRCVEEGCLEFHHVRPYGVGGETTVVNIELRCRAHNDYEAERFYGRRFIPAPQRKGAAAEATELGPGRVGTKSPSRPSASSSSPTGGPWHASRQGG